MSNKYAVIATILVIFFVASCKNDKSTSQELLNNVELVDDDIANKPDLSSHVVDDIINSIPSPIELTALLKFIGADYSDKMLNPIENVHNYSTNYQKAINLGVYGADLGYINFYNKPQTALRYIRTIKHLAEEQNVGQFFNFKTLSRLAGSSENVDSLIFITTRSFDKMDYYLRTQNRAEVGIQILIGGWIEGLFLATQIVEEYPNKILEDVISSQKYALEDMIRLMQDYKDHPGFVVIIKHLEELTEVYNSSETPTIITEETNDSLENEIATKPVKFSEFVELNSEQLMQLRIKLKDIRDSIINI